MNIAYKILSFILLALLALPLYALVINLLILSDVFPTEQLNYNIGEDLTRNAIYVWMGSLVFGMASIFVKTKIRMLLLLTPLIAPSLYAIFYSIGL